MLFLQILGAVFISMILMIVVLYLWVRWYLRRAAKNFGKAIAGMGEAFEAVKSATPPDRIHLSPTDPVEFTDRQKERQILDALTAEGFTDLGSFSIAELPAVKTHALMNVEQAVYAVIHEMEPVGVILDLVTEYPDGSSCTYSTTPETGVEKPPGKTSVKDRSADARSLFRRLIAERKGGPYVPVSASAFPRVFEKAYADEQDWRNLKGGLSEREIRQIASRSGDEVSENAIQLALIAEASRAREATHNAVKERFYESAGWTEARQQDMKGRLVVIHDKSGPGDVVAAFVSAIETDESVDEEDDPRVKEATAIAASQPPRQAFSKLNARLPVQRRHKKLGEVTQPIGADVYDAPWLESEDDEEEDDDEE